ncbi:MULTISPECIES: bifunctional 4-hydroxy-2-oxoglutarate aldolase/2-dehydro-3-deoxy-phosphogluconate aldolase [Arthrobacter]|uniref:bifunctional 4-hydroxy-2-oxoglutarate aldolase/2-dehydro-3-deoxy-phosphogluconate aldolase n=1 Tax=Arthrobacter TaxID=1663 RepID=UPI0028F72402|nr:bifunctional 4-hydroxy-2-oxoglutarate aldolase/2-dehydro-3-deoxy-phosphogluconate aldolase [Arthrobacter sp. lap29]
MNATEFIARLEDDRTLAVVRAPKIADAAELCHALVAGGINSVELTYTTPNLLQHLTRAAGTASQHGAVVGVGTVLTAEQAKAAIDAGAQFLVTPGLRPEVAQVAVAAGIPFAMGAMTPTEVAMALDLGSAVVKIFPASAMGPSYLKDLQGPFPGIKLLPSGGINSANAKNFLDAGALAVCCGTAVVPPAVVAAGTWTEITARAGAFTAILS